MENYFDRKMSIQEVNAISCLGLAHMGDAVFELLVRSWLCSHGNTTVRNLHKESIRYVSAPAQSKFMELLLPRLTEDEAAVYRRGRNTHVHSIPKSATAKEYTRATGLECLFGYLFLTGQQVRANELFVTVMEEIYGI